MSDQLPDPKRHILAAWVVGSVIYMILAMEVIADAGVFAFPFQVVMGAVFSIVFVGFAMPLGFLVSRPPLERLWYSSVIVPVLLLACATFVILFGQSIGLTTTLTSSETGSTYKTLHPAAAYGSMLAAVFATLHFPSRRASPNTPNA